MDLPNPIFNVPLGAFGGPKVVQMQIVVSKSDNSPQCKNRRNAKGEKNQMVKRMTLSRCSECHISSPKRQRSQQQMSAQPAAAKAEEPAQEQCKEAAELPNACKGQEVILYSCKGFNDLPLSPLRSLRQCCDTVAPTALPSPCQQCHPQASTRTKLCFEAQNLEVQHICQEVYHLRTATTDFCNGQPHDNVRCAVSHPNGK